MSILPLISHHLFVSAVANDGDASGKSTNAAAGGAAACDTDSAVPLEILDVTAALPERAAQQMAWGTGADC
jgi:hypothetical protein